MNSDAEQTYEAVWSEAPLQITREEYDIAMSHVEQMRHTAEENNASERLEEGDEDYLDPHNWKLSDTLLLTLKEGEREMTEQQATKQDLVRKGLRILAEDVWFSEPCTDDDADDVF